MQQFITEHKEIVWFIVVVIFTIIMISISRLSLNFIEKKWSKGEKFSSVFNVLRYINTFFYSFLGIGLLSYLLFEKESYAIINRSLGIIIWVSIVASLTIIIVAISQSYFKNKINHISKRDQGDVTIYKYVNNLSTFFIYTIGIILIALAIPSLRSVAASAAAGAGVFALIAGVAAQEGISNLIGGLFIAFFKPFRIGDIVKIGNDIMGRVEDMNLRHTVINNFQNKRVIIPNAIINKENIVNYYLHDFKICEWIEVGISYDSDMDVAIDIIRTTCEAHPHALDNRTDDEKANGLPKVDVQVIALANSSITIKAWVWAASYTTGFKMRNQLYKSIKEKFDAAGVEIPYPHQTIVLKNKTS